MRESLSRHEYFLSNKLKLCESDLVLDAGCGIMGPARNIHRLSGAKIVGLNINEYQVKRSKFLNEREGFGEKLDCVEGDFTRMDFEDGKFDHVYSIEALCHAPNRLSAYREIFRVLKPGGCFVFYDWLLTPKFDSKNREHQSIKNRIEKGNGLAEMISYDNIENLLKKAGFVIEEKEDLASKESMVKRGNLVPWYDCFDTISFENLRTSKFTIGITNKIVYLLETLKIAPKGSHDVHNALSEGADSLTEGGKMGMFSPMYFVLARKPLV